MTDFKTSRGILVLVDIVNFTKQANDLGTEYTAEYSEYFRETITRPGARACSFSKLMDLRLPI